MVLCIAKGNRHATMQYTPVPVPWRFSSSGGMEGINVSSSDSGPFVDGDAGVGSQMKAASDVNTSISSRIVCVISEDDQGEMWFRRPRTVEMGGVGFGLVDAGIVPPYVGARSYISLLPYCNRGLPELGP